MTEKYRLSLLMVILGCFICMTTPLLSHAQTNSDALLDNYITRLNNMREKLPVEKLYMQTDKPYYVLGDTLRFKSYLLYADYLKASTRSGLLYIELDNAANQAVKRIVVPVTSGVSWGDIILDEAEIPEGSYKLRAYTNWMRNFGDAYIFKKNIYVSAINGATLIKAGFTLDTSAEKNRIKANLYFANSDKEPIRLADFKLQVLNGYHTQARYKASTGVDGSMSLNIDVAEKAAITNLSIKAQQLRKGSDTATLTIPVTLNRPEKTDLQFMPEGGAMVAGIQTKIGFKAISEDGKGADVHGKIIDSKLQEVADFKSTYKGMGAFELTPQAGESYTARITLPGGTIKNYRLPNVNISGTTLKVTTKGVDSLLLSINASPGIIAANSGKNYIIVAQARGVVCYVASFDMTDNVLTKTLPTSLFPTGITRFTILNSQNEPLNERVVYVDHHDNLRINIKTNKPVYSTRDSIGLAMHVTDKNGKPVQGTFSMSVTDDSQVNTGAGNDNFVNNVLLTSDLKGVVEEPGYYFKELTPSKAAALDNLLLTQGWVGYDWKAIFDTKTMPPKYLPEKEFAVQGKVTNLFNKPVKHTKVGLLRKSPFLIADTVTDNEGRFAFNGNDLLSPDSAFFLVEAKNKSGKSNYISVSVDEFSPPIFTPVKQNRLPWYVNSDTLLLNNQHSKATQLQAEAINSGLGKTLKEVIIKQQKIIPGSQNPTPEYNSVVFDEKDMNAAKKMTLFEFLQSKFKGMYISGGIYFLKSTFIISLNIDGRWAPTRFTVDNLTAENIKGIEVVYKMLPGKYDAALLYITTYSGNGAFQKHIPGTYVYKPIPFSFPKQFYRPRYTASNVNTALGTDLRSTIHWEYNIVTDKDGKAVVSFYSADKPATYTVTVEGSNLDGSIGSQQSKIKIATGKPTP